jgi:hypothetical protein
MLTIERKKRGFSRIISAFGDPGKSERISTPFGTIVAHECSNVPKGSCCICLADGVTWFADQLSSRSSRYFLQEGLAIRLHPADYERVTALGRIELPA